MNDAREQLINEMRAELSHAKERIAALEAEVALLQQTKKPKKAPAEKPADDTQE